MAIPHLPVVLGIQLTTAYRRYKANIVARLKNDIWFGVVGVDCHYDLHFRRSQSRIQATDLVG
jgi:hypothetical protein